jgi:hypothetical protein
MNSILSYLTFTIPSLLFKKLYFLSLSFFFSFLYPFLTLSHSSLRTDEQNRQAEPTGQNRPSTASDSSTVVDVQFRPVLSTSSGSSMVLDELLGCSHRSILSGRFIWFSFGRTGCTDKSLGSSFLILGLFFFCF